MKSTKSIPGIRDRGHYYSSPAMYSCPWVYDGTLLDFLQMFFFARSSSQTDTQEILLPWHHIDLIHPSCIRRSMMQAPDHIHVYSYTFDFYWFGSLSEAAFGLIQPCWKRGLCHVKEDATKLWNKERDETDLCSFIQGALTNLTLSVEIC